KDAEVEKNRPHVVSISPANGDNSVDPAIDTLVITFDRPMTHGRYSLCGDGDSFPQVVSPPRYNENRTVLTVGIRLAPDSAYQFSLNCQNATGFRSEQGTPLKPLPVSFQTRK
ncbi:MAG: Ig-like domain-containing protein, partial [Phycisphaerae bacterium]